MKIIIIHPNSQFRCFLKMALEEMFPKPEILEFKSRKEAGDVLFGNSPDFNLGIVFCDDEEVISIFKPESEKSKALSRPSKQEFKNAVEEVLSSAA